MRISATDWAEGGWDLASSVQLAQALKATGMVDLIDCSSGGLVQRQKPIIHPGYQVPFAAAVRSGAGIATSAVGMIHGADMAEQIVANGQADMVSLGRAMLIDPVLAFACGQCAAREDRVAGAVRARQHLLRFGRHSTWT